MQPEMYDFSTFCLLFLQQKLTYIMFIVIAIAISQMLTTSKSFPLVLMMVPNPYS